MTPQDGFCHWPGHLSADDQSRLLAQIREVIAAAPLFKPTMPGSGKPFSVMMTNCGELGWVSDRAGGYRYQTIHPSTGRPWPPIPQQLIALWTELSCYPAPPEACLVNYYAAGAKMGSHRDLDEDDRAAPVLSLSLGDDAVFHIGGLSRRDRKRHITLRSGDVAMLAGSARMAFHGIDRVIAGTSRLLAEGGRMNLTLRRVRRLPLNDRSAVSEIGVE
jgi:alkylated DNA repair protein (DNA oxidative demethylase)